MFIFGPPKECIACALREPCSECPFAPDDLEDDDSIQERMGSLMNYWLLSGGPLRDLARKLGIEQFVNWDNDD